MVNKKTICIDENAHNILVEVKEEMRGEGISGPTLSDAVRWMNQKAKEKPPHRAWKTSEGD